MYSMLSKTTASHIVSEIHRIIAYDINIMDENAFITASTDPARIGTFHEGAKKLILQELSELAVYSEDEYIGAREGINLPIMINSRIIGVVGITGPHEEVRNYGQIIKRMTEILLLDISGKKQAIVNEQMRKSLLEEYIFGGAAVNQFQIDRGRSLGIDIALPRRTLILDILPLEDTVDNVSRTLSRERISAVVRETVCSGGSDNIVSTFNDLFLLLVCLQNDAQIVNLVEQIDQALQNEGRVRIRAGTALRAQTFGELHISFLQAMKALSAARANESMVGFYHSAYLEVFLGEISDNLKQEYLNNIFKGAKSEDIREWMAILKEFYAQNGSVSRTSEKLFVHKNTLQYKLRRIMNQTLMDPRDICNAAVFEIAIRFYYDAENR